MSPNKKNKKLPKKDKPKLIDVPGEFRFQVPLAGPADSEAPIKKSLVKKYWKIIWAVVVGTGVIITILRNFPEAYKNVSQSSEERYETDKFKQGDLTGPIVDTSGFLHSNGVFKKADNPMIFKSDPIGTNYPKIDGILIEKYSDSDFVNNGVVWLKVGHTTLFCKAKDLFEPQNILIASNTGCSFDKQLIIGVRDSRLYVSAEFKDFQKEETVGWIEFNHWKVFNDNMLTYNSTKYKFEVRDRQNYVVFGVSYDKNIDMVNLSRTMNEMNLAPTALVFISGYLIDESSVLIMGNNTKGAVIIDKSLQPTCISKSSPEWKTKAEAEIKTVLSTFQ